MYMGPDILQLEAADKQLCGYIYKGAKANISSVIVYVNYNLVLWWMDLKERALKF